MNDKLILIVDDDKKICELIDFRLSRRGYTTASAVRGDQALEEIKKTHPTLVMLDVRLPDMNGVDLLKKIKEQFPNTNVIMISAHADIKLAVDCMKEGAYDFIEKPFSFPELDAKVKHVFDQYHLKEEVSMLRKELGEKYKMKTIIGKSEAMQKVFRSIDLAEKSDVSVMIDGESGTGKELVARAIHFNSAQKNGPFVAVNCGAIPENLLESELFGHEKGAFTGAIARKAGKFEQAEGGTIFLDEVSDLPGSLQVKLLRVLQEREIERVGGTESIPIHARFIAATNGDLKKLISDGKFREDLYFRIHVFPIRIPPLRERKDDIPELLKYFLKKYKGQDEKPFRIDAAGLKKIMEYHWPGNIRELENFVERLALVKGNSEVITEEDINALDAFGTTAPVIEPTAVSWDSKDKVTGEVEKNLLQNAIKEAGGNISKASKILNISRDTFYRKMKKYALAY